MLVVEVHSYNYHILVVVVVGVVNNKDIDYILHSHNIILDFLFLYSLHIYLNTSQKEDVAAAVADFGVSVNEEVPSGLRLRVRVVGFVNKNMVVSSGRGTPEAPYKLK